MADGAHIANGKIAIFQ